MKLIGQEQDGLAWVSWKAIKKLLTVRMQLSVKRQLTTSYKP